MKTELYKIKNLLIDAAEVGAARVIKHYEPKSDRLTQRQAFVFFRERDTAFGGEFIHGEKWVRDMVKQGHIIPVRVGKAPNSPLYYSKTELLAVRAACEVKRFKTLENIL